MVGEVEEPEDGFGAVDAVGDAAPIWATRLHFNDGSRVDLSTGGVVVFVGANNVGKSTALRDLGAKLREEPLRGHHVINRVDLGSVDDSEAALVRWVEEHFPKQRQNPGDPLTYGTQQGSVRENALKNKPLEPNTVRQIKRVLTFIANAEQRLGLTRASQPVDRRTQLPQTPIQGLYNEVAKIEKLSEAARDAFGHPLTFTHMDGVWRLRMGVPKHEVEITGRHMFASDQTMRELESLPVVEEQGDGLRSYIGVLLELLAERHLFIVLDEPEAFLHPPQARQLGRELLRLKPDQSQLFVSTHDSNLIRGLIEGATDEVTVVRISREGQANPITVVSPQAINEVASDPVLKHTSVLDALFSTAAIVCEAESDCQLYESTLQDNSLIPPGVSLHLVGSSGKSRVPRTCNLLRALGVPTAAILDFDVLRSAEQTIAIVEAVNGSCDDGLSERIQRTVAELSNLARDEVPDLATLKSDLLAQFPEDDHDAPASPQIRRELRRVVEDSGDWATFKRVGADGLGGEPRRRLTDLLRELSDLNVHVVPVGELESWFRDATPNKSMHVAEVLDNGMHTDERKNAGIVEFLNSVVDSLARANG